MVKIEEEIKKLKKCIRNKDERLKAQGHRLERIETRYSKILWTFAIIGIILLFTAMTYTLAHIHNELPDSVIEPEYKTYEINDALQFFGFYILCFLAVSGMIAWLILLYMLLKNIYGEE